MATKDFKIRHSLTVAENATIEGNLTLGGNTVSRLIDSDEVQSIINSSVTGLADSDLKAIADLRNDVDSDSLAIQNHSGRIATLEARADSDELQLQTINTRIDNLSTGFDSDQVVAIISENSDSQAINTTVYTFTSPANDSEFTGTDDNGLTLAYTPDKVYVYLNGVLLVNTTDYIATNGTSIILVEAPDSENVLQVVKHEGTVQSGFDSDQVVAIINENVVSGSVDSDVAAIAQLRRDADSDSLRIQAIATEIEQLNVLVDSDLKAIADLRNDVDSDSAKLQALEITVAGLPTTSFDSEKVASVINHGLELGEFYLGLDPGVDEYNTPTNLWTHVGGANGIYRAGNGLNRTNSTGYGVSSILSIDSDTIIGIINENVVSGSVDSDVAAIAQLRRDADSDSLRIQAIATEIEQLNVLVDSDLKAIADLRNDVDSDSAAIQATRTEMDVSFNIVSNGASAYTFTGDGFPSGVDNPTLYLNRGHTYNFRVNASGHPFEIRLSNGGSAYSTGVTNNAAQIGEVKFVVPMDAPETLVYQCTVHSGMVGTIKIGKQGFDSDQIASMILENSSGSGMTDSDLAVVAKLRADVDSDSAKLQALEETVAGLSVGGSGMTDSDLKVVADLRNDITALQTGGVVSQESTFTTFKYKAAQGQTTFSGLDRDNQTLAYTVGNINVYINGILLNDSDDYTATNGTSVVLDLAADSDDVVVIQKMRSAFDSDTILSIWNNNQSNLTISRYDYTAIQSQTVFSGADDNGNSLSYVQDKIQVFLNGILLVGTDDYTATNGTSLTLTVAADSDDKISIIKYLGADAQASDNLSVTRFTYKYTVDGNGVVGDSEITGGDENGNTLSYVAGKIQVYSNGILLEDSDDYIATDGSTITLRAAPDSDDVVSIFKYLGTTQSGFDSEQVVAIVNENSSGVTTGKAIAMAIVFGG